MMLYLRNASPGEFFFGLSSKEKKYSRTYKMVFSDRKKLVYFLDRFLLRSGVSLSSLNGIALSIDSGGFSQVRLTTTLANTLAMSLGIPIWGVSDALWRDMWRAAPNINQKPQRWVFPLYHKEPNITQ